MKILMLSSRLPYPLTAGFRIRIYNEAKQLKQAGHQVDLLFLSRRGDMEKYGSALYDVFTTVRAVPFSLVKAGGQLFSALFHPGYPFQVALYQNGGFASALYSVYAQYDMIIANHIRTAEYLRQLPEDKIILDLHDAISYNYYNAIQLSRGLKKLLYLTEYRRVLHYECCCSRQYKKTVLISEKDRQWLISHGASAKNLHVIPLAVRDDISVPPKDYHNDRHAIAFLGKMSYQPNADAVRWSVRKVFPLLRKKEPELQFYIMGIEPPKDIQDLGGHSGISVTGFMENPFLLLSKMKVSVVPIQNGAGTQNKLLESMMLGVPVVASRIAAEGIAGSDGRELLIADSPQQYAEHILSLLHSESLRERIGRDGQRLIENKYTWNSLTTQWLSLLSSSARKD